MTQGDLLRPGTYVVAVSGGVDSVVLLDMLVAEGAGELIVAHFDHGIRDDSASDAEFVRVLAASYKLPFVTKREELGAGASEERARQRRYAFLRAVAAENDAKIVTAHHADDIVETVAINLKRGTGWRGLAVLDSPDIVRPLLGRRKYELLTYAKARGLQWREDSTNRDMAYLRNSIRARIAQQLSDDEIRQTLALHAAQCELKRHIDNEARQLAGSTPYSRYFFTQLPEPAALELLRTVCITEVGVSPTIPQRQRALMAIKVAQAGSRYEVAAGVVLQLKKREFTVVTG